ncbi:hypothetical protein CLUG_03367 [Clavispora lusitaniae ATCC 42720]|uniref:Cysteine dioxygenase n=2 Tax=Clavispora lusitaniae TaxID=36911 RepID=C4Y5D3_CLAL4|nr:uncharacterized protein CLUG_03367 [Clavispora lusitaniae ATCC 42720]EEQ39239.1 hypothetical protein CLUG_03367 [Clavispora lusitaniae ATCC 42720]
MACATQNAHIGPNGQFCDASPALCARHSRLSLHTPSQCGWPGQLYKTTVAQSSLSSFHILFFFFKTTLHSPHYTFFRNMIALNASSPVSQTGCQTFGCLEQETNNDFVLDNAFGHLVDRLRSLLGSSGLASEDVDVAQVKKIMEEYTSDEKDWGRFALRDATKGYTRNGIVNINGNANLLILVWTPGKGSAVHDHANAHCCMKVLKGQLTESLYDVPDHEGDAMTPRQVSVLHRDEVGYISDKIGLHRISNESPSEFAVSLHLYTPPYAALYGCSMYETATSKKHHVNMSRYYSWQGTVLNQKGASTC